MAGRRSRAARPPFARSQHFLRSRTLAAALVRESGVGPNDLALDLGAGSGRLTEALSRVARRVVAVELDPFWAQRLRGRWRNVEVVQDDATCLPLPREPFQVVANPPFDRTTSLLHLLLDDPATPLVRADLVVEWDVARKRALPWPSTLNGVLWGASYDASVSRRIRCHAFDPSPSVDAGLLVFRRRERALVPPELGHDYRRFVARGFRHGLRSIVPARSAPSREARDLDAHEWADLFLRHRLPR